MSKVDAARAGRIDTERLAPGMTRQLAAFRTAIARGTPRLGWKIGINVPAVQAALGLDRPLVGCLDGASVSRSGVCLEIPEGALLHVEPELALEITGIVSPTASAEATRAAIAAVAPAFEVVDYARGGSDLDALLAHSMFHAGTVLGDFQPLPDLGAAGVDWPILWKDGKRVGAPRRDLMPRDIGQIVAGVAQTLAAFGERLAPGDLILSGSFMERAVRLAAGSKVLADFGPLGSIELDVAR